MFLKIVNRGEIEVAALCLVGASVKGVDSIGFFGSGNKYAMAVLLRAGIEFRVFSGVREIPIETREVALRGETFEQIWIDGRPTSLTTRMGPTWETWFALREFVCNALDEGGFEIGLTQDVVSAEGKTTIFVKATPPVMEFFGSFDKYVFLGEPLFTMTSHCYGKCSIVREAEELSVYRKGVCVTQEQQRTPALFHYDFEKVDINESRVYQYDFQVRDRVATVLAAAPIDVVRRVVDHLHVAAKVVESQADWSDVLDAFSSAWEEVLRDRMIMPEKYVSYAPGEDVMTSVVLPDALIAKLVKQWPKLHVWGAVGGQYEEVPYDGDAIARACAEVAEFGYLDARAQVKTVIFDKDNVCASYCEKTGVMAIDVRYTDDYDELVSTVLEEALHVKGYSDGSREFEQFLMRELVAAKRAAR